MSNHITCIKTGVLIVKYMAVYNFFNRPKLQIALLLPYFRRSFIYTIFIILFVKNTTRLIKIKGLSILPTTNANITRLSTKKSTYSKIIR